MSFMTGYILGGIAAESAAHTKETVLNFQRHRQSQRTAQTVASWQQYAAGLEGRVQYLQEREALAEKLIIEADRQALEQRLAQAEALAKGWETSAREYHGIAKTLEGQNAALRQQLSGTSPQTD